MPFATDALFADRVGNFYGEYLTTFTSENGQVRADFFRRGDQLIAYISFPTKVEPTAVTDRYVGEVRAYAQEHGFEGRFRMIYSS